MNPIAVRPRVLLLLFVLLSGLGFQTRSAPDEPVYLGFLGDTGTGKDEQWEVAAQLEKAMARGKLDYVFTLGDNIYNEGEAKYIQPRYLDVYRPLLEGGVRVHAALGNHDVKPCDVVDLDVLPRGAGAYENGDCEVVHQLDPRNRFGYPGGRRYYSVLLPGDPPLAEVFVLDTNTLAIRGGLFGESEDTAQLTWLETSLAGSRATWKIVTMHNPLHSPSSAGWFVGHKPELGLREQLEPIFRRHGVDVVFQGHNHFYSRMVPQHGIQYFVSGGGGQRIYRYEHEEGYTLNVYNRGKFHHFVHARIEREAFTFCTIDLEGNVRDGGAFAPSNDVVTPTEPGHCPF